MKIKDWIELFGKLEELGATEESELKLFSESGAPYEIKKSLSNEFSLEKDEKEDVFKIWIK